MGTSVTPLYFDSLNKSLPDAFISAPVANILIGSAAASFPNEILYVGLMVANTWSASVGVTSGTYVTGTAFSSTNRHIYQCIQNGITGTTEPPWTMTPGGITYDSVGSSQTVVWEEASVLFNQSILDGVEPTDTAYQRAAFNNLVVQFQDPNSVNPNIEFSPTLASWGQVVGCFISDDSTTGQPGNVYAWGLFSSPAAVLSASVSPVLPVSGSGFGAAIVGSPTIANSASGSVCTISRMGVVPNNILVLAVPNKGSSSSNQVLSVSDTGGATWSQVASVSASNTAIEWWQGLGDAGGNITVTTTLHSGNNSGATLFEVVNGSAVAPGPTNATSVFVNNYSSITVGSQPGALVIAATNASVNTGYSFSNPTAPWIPIAGPITTYSTIAPLAYQTTHSDSVTAAWGPTVDISAWAIAGIVVTPGSSAAVVIPPPPPPPPPHPANCRTANNAQATKAHPCLTAA